jgi:hypothetical protein
MATPTEINLVNSSSVTWSAGAPYPDPNNPEATRRDVTATAIATPITWLGAWNSSTAYVVGDAVSLSGSSYLCISPNTNQTPPNATYWGVLATSIALAGDLGGTTSSPKVVGIQGVGVSATAPTNGQVLEYNSGSGLYVPANAGGVSLVSANNAVAQSTSAFALKGAIVTPLQNLTLQKIFANIYGNSGDQYVAALATITGTSTIGSIVATSATYTFGSTETGIVVFDMGGASLSASTKYGIWINIISGSGTTPCEMDFPSAAAWLGPGFVTLSTTATALRSANVSPAGGTTLSTTAGNPSINVAVSF